jgi:hypothetical protein
MPPPLTYALLRRAFDAGAKPHALVISHMTLAGHPRVHVAELSELLGPIECAELAWVADDAGLFNALMTQSLLPSARYRLALRGRVLAGLKGVPPGRDVPGELLRAWSDGRGMERRAVDGRYDGRMEPQLERSVYSEPWKVLWVYEQYVRRIARLAEDHGVPVFWLVAPIAPEAQARRDALGLDAHHTKNLRAIQKRSPNLVVLDARHAGFPAPAFFDSCHLNTRGASALSAEVASAVASHLSRGGERWVTLPPYGAAARVAVEPRRGSESNRR